MTHVGISADHAGQTGSRHNEDNISDAGQPEYTQVSILVSSGPTSTCRSTTQDVRPSKLRLPTSIKRLNRLLSHQNHVAIPESDLEEKFVKGENAPHPAL